MNMTVITEPAEHPFLVGVKTKSNKYHTAEMCTVIKI